MSLTTRQSEIKDLLDEGLGAREIGERLDISRNAVYQQIAAMRRKGVLEPGWTPSGETRLPAGTSADEHARSIVEYTTGDDGEAVPPAYMTVIRDLVEMNRELVRIVERLTAQSARTA